MGIEHASPAMVFFLLCTIGTVFYFARTKRAVRIRKVPGIDAIDYGVSIAAETGRPTVFSTGLTGVGPTLFACLGILKRVAGKTALFKSKLLIPQNSPEVTAIVETVARESYFLAGRPDQFDPQSVVFLSEEQFAFASGYAGLVQRERAGTCFLFGSFAAESLILAEAGNQVGAFQVAGSVSPEQIPFFICSCDYTLIGEEIFAASAYVTEDVEQRASLAAQDWLKVLVMAVIVLGVLTTSMQSIFPEYNLFDVRELILGVEKRSG